MKLWLPGIVILLLAFQVQAENYRVVYSPSLELEVYIDNVVSKSPDDWCQATLPLRLVTGNRQDPAVLSTFLPRVGTLLANQCGALDLLPWQMVSKTGNVLASGSASKLQNWRTIVMTDAVTGSADRTPSLPGLSQPASRTPLQHFDLPGGCRVRTAWDENTRALFIPDIGQQPCPADGWVQGNSELTIVADGQQTKVPVTFYQGYPFASLLIPDNRLTVVAANNQRMIVTQSGAADSWLLLPFDNAHHVWRFGGTLLIKVDQQAARQNPEAVKTQVDSLRSRWARYFMPQQKVNVLLIDTLHADQVDPAVGAWRNLH